MLSFLENSWLAMLLAALVAYLLGSVNFAILVTKRFSGKDIRSFGSGNAGATNVLRSQGKLPAVLTFVGDLLKSMVAVFIGGLLLQVLQLAPAEAHNAELLMYNAENLRLVGAYLAGVLCLIGHIYPVFFQFKGGKGVMTTFGMTLLLDWKTALIMLGIFLVVVLLTRMVSLGSILAGVAMPFITFGIRHYANGQRWETAAFCSAVAVLIAVIVIVKHRENIVRICKGTENKIGKK